MQGKQVQRPNRGLLLAAAALTLAGCAARQDVASADGSAPEAGAQASATTGSAVPGGVTRWGNTTASMADQYRPRSSGVTVAAAGASAWVKPSPSPAFVLSNPLPPAGPPAPPPAAVANRQPGTQTPGPAPAPAPTRPVVAASDIVRPEAAAPPPPPQSAPAPDPAVRARGLALFNDYSCGACHALADARAAGSIGPSFDRNPRLARAFAIDVITNGRGAMPAFGGQITDAEIEILTDYIVQFARQ